VIAYAAKNNNGGLSPNLIYRDFSLNIERTSLNSIRQYDGVCNAVIKNSAIMFSSVVPNEPVIMENDFKCFVNKIGTISYGLAFGVYSAAMGLMPIRDKLLDYQNSFYRYYRNVSGLDLINVATVDFANLNYVINTYIIMQTNSFMMSRLLSPGTSTDSMYSLLASMLSMSNENYKPSTFCDFDSVLLTDKDYFVLV
jgi:hypothetical protein